MLFTLISLSKDRPIRLLRWLFKITKRKIQPVIILPKGSLGMEEALKLGRVLREVSDLEHPIILGFAESLTQADAFCKQISDGKLGMTSPRILPVLVNATRMGLDGEGRDFSQQLEGLLEKWNNNFGLTCFLEFGRDSSRISEASSRTSLFTHSNFVFELGTQGLRRLKREGALAVEWREKFGWLPSLFFHD
ncbi:hypothetical protein CH373_03065 [Leptospira perolatii]|uniref:Uncharacterized protein n=1 Tax=Leptospira perolatii TaxID=2023191 RepID=A0A2M9ZSS9_9LEPT|nr:hypothetical protein [Leptospira perolatii]PJZ71484.1 hypothetical protein CH360_03060 [Leptospira perolatii]PJZ75019.1 hypothetical protein CH373_03065 [Leptospira perolatii]